MAAAADTTVGKKSFAVFLLPQLPSSPHALQCLAAVLHWLVSISAVSG